MAKKLVALLLATATAMSLVACGGNAGTAGTGDAGNTGGTDKPAGTESSTPQEESNGGGAAEERGYLQPNQETGNTTKTDETIVVNFGSFPSTLYAPSTGASPENQEQMVLGCILDTLVNKDVVTGEIIPNLASSWEVLDDTHIKFVLRDDVVMSDGTPLVADDVVYSVTTWVTMCGRDESGQGGNDIGKFLRAAVAEDEHTVTVELYEACPAFVGMLTWACFGIISEDEVNALGGLEAIARNPQLGTGKYRFKEWKDGEYILLERNEEYWNKDYVGYFKNIKFVAINDNGAAAASVQSGDVDITWQMPIAQATAYADNDKVKTYIFKNGEVEHLWFNHGEGHPTADIRVRQAIHKAIDYATVATVATAGLGGKVYSYAAETAPYYVATWTDADYERDIEGAKALLAEAGYANGLTLACPTLPDLVDVYQVIQANLSEIGITLDIQEMDMGAFVPALLINKDYDITLVGADITDRTPGLTCFVDGGMSFGGPGAMLEADKDILTRLNLARTDDDAKVVLAEYDNYLRENLTCSNAYEAYSACLVGADIKGYAKRERSYPDPTNCFK